ncbi:MAG TPA: hypothetical protein PLP23_18435 [Panacibacter sp.]|nr:hypothetical protein [Panacibacter sp.]
MRIIFLIAIMISVTVLKAQTILPGSFLDYTNRAAFANNIHLQDSTANKKWSFSKYSGISTTFSFFKGGNATVVSAPIGLQLNRKLNDNLYAFANISVAPAYISFNRSFVNGDFNKANQSNGFYKSNSFGVYSSASLGLMYVNDAKTFSISGSIGIEKSSYPMLPYYQLNNARPNPVSPVNR